MPTLITAADVVHLHPQDNICVAARDLPGGTVVSTAAGSVTIAEPVTMGHKIALAAIGEGERVLKFGQPIGLTTRAVKPGEWVHSQNLHNGEFERDYAFATEVPAPLSPITGRTFMGYRRASGKAATRNYIAIISTVNCSASVSKAIARGVSSELLAKYPNVDGIVPLTHTSGCATSSSSKHIEFLHRVMSGYAKHPNIVGCLIVGLGCEVATPGELVSRGKLVQLGMPRVITGQATGAGSAKPQAATRPGPIIMSMQDMGGTRKTIERGIELISDMLPLANDVSREPIPASELILGTECGGSDGYSGITANPALGFASDMIVACGGTSILSETTEIYGAEHLLTRRAVSEKVGRKLLDLIEWWKWYAGVWGLVIDNNPSQGNKAGGLTTIYEKSLGAVAKGGTTALRAVYEYAQEVTEKGFVVMDSPGFDPPSVTGMVAGGANMVCFTTGRGSCFGCKPVPSIKIATNTPMFQRMEEDMDINAGAILQGVPVEEVGKQIFETILAVASGKRTKSEELGLGDEEFLPWHLGPVL